MLTVHTLNDRICAHSHNAAHGTEIPPNVRILFCNGQVGARLDGTVPEDPLEQIEVIFERIRTILAASNMTFEDVEASAAAAQEVFSARGLIVPPEPPRTDAHEVLDRKGLDVMAHLHGERAHEGYAAPGNAITGALYPTAVRYGYGELWSRPGLDRRQRMLCALAAFTAMGLESQLRKFAKSALNVGLSREEVIEAVIQTAPYGGFPRALNGLAILSGVFQGAPS
jgi:alkylhydroperoxidase/carboxymuconolactone decarboxylase family protein YurZ